jgi:hypothetical protein
VSASQLASGLNTQSFALNWMPTTGEFGFNETFGDHDHHQKVATRLGAHYTHSREDKQSQPGTNTIENSQVRLSDGSIVFTPDLFGPGITVDMVHYDMTSVDAGVKYKGRYGNASEVQADLNWYFVKERGLRVNAEWLHLNKCPVGYTAVPYPVGGNGNVFHTNIEMNF